MIDGMARDRFPYSEHRATESAFFWLVMPQVRTAAADALAYALGRNILDEAGAEPLIQKLWSAEEEQPVRHDRTHELPPLAE